MGGTLYRQKREFERKHKTGSMGIKKKIVTGLGVAGKRKGR